mgnify:CR=1 FL=1|tara:strand:+ start:287 stop:1117 length:831 start_codon:yes stop_codon:yes gene_type:complete
MLKPRYPIYIPSKNRADVCYTAKFFLQDNVDFKIVVEPSQKKAYENIFGNERLLILPEDGLRLLGSRLWIREHSLSLGYDRHWQFDDNILYIGRYNKGKRIKCDSNPAICAVEDFTDRYTNIGVSGFNYEMFVVNQKAPYILNHKVYSGSLINNRMDYKWRLYYNDDVDLCLQCLINGLCTVQFNAFHIKKMTTMKVKGGNTDDLYQKDGRLLMARTIEEVYPKYCQTKIRFGRPQHVVNWDAFKGLKLIRRKDINWEELENKTNNYGLELKQIKK